MGLSLCYELRLTGDAAKARDCLRQLHAFAHTQNFEEVTDLVELRAPDLPPEDQDEVSEEQSRLLTVFGSQYGQKTLKDGREVWIDILKGRNLPAPAVPAAPPVAVAEAEPPAWEAAAAQPVASLEAELGRARDLLQSGKTVIGSMFADVRMGRALEVGRALPLVDAASRSLSRDPRGFLQSYALSTEEQEVLFSGDSGAFDARARRALSDALDVVHGRAKSTFVPKPKPLYWPGDAIQVRDVTPRKIAPGKVTLTVTGRFDDPSRLELARRTGIEALDVSQHRIADAWSDLGLSEGFDVGLEISGQPSALTEMLENLNHGGKVALLGLSSDEFAIDWSKVVTHMITIQGIYGRQMFETWYLMTAMLSSGLDVTPVITDRFAAAEWEQAFATARAGLGGKVIIEWGEA